jgi:HEAT repeat protein
LGAIHLQPDICIPVLLPLVRSSNTNTWLRAEALSAIRNFGPTARGIVPVTEIMPSLNDPDETVRAHATNILRQLQ